MELHHIAMVTTDIKGQLSVITGLGFKKRSDIIEDDIQKVKVAFIDIGKDVLLELIEPTGEDSPAYGALKKGGGLSHLCYKVDNLKEAVENSTEKDKKP